MIAAGAVTYPKIQNVAASSLWGNPTTTSATGSEIPLGDGLAFSGGSLTCSVNTASQAMTLISSAAPTGSVITFSSITSAFTSLRLAGFARSDGAGTGSAVVQMTFNGDTTSSYLRQFAFANGTSPTALQNTASFIAAGELAKAGDLASYGCAFEVDILGYTTSFQKTVIGHYNAFNNTTTASFFDITHSSGWPSTASISKIELNLSSGSFVAGSLVSLYGIA